MEIQIKEFVKPIITINYEDLTKNLNAALEEYKGIVVTEETLKGCKAAQKELAGLRKDIEEYRKEKKREAEQPIKEFEAQCKSLVSLIAKVEDPIKEGITYFDNQRREEKRERAKEIIAEECEKAGLNEKYAAQCLLLEKYTNLTATESGVREDVSRQCFALKVEQDREADRNKIIEETLEYENERLKNKISLEDIRKIIDFSADTSKIVASIRKYAASLFDAENYEETGAEPVKEPEPVGQVPEIPEGVPQEAKEPQYCATYKITGTADQLRSVSGFLRQNSISYDVLEQREAGVE